MCSLEKRIRDLIHFYVRENYNNYLTTNNIIDILESDIPNVVEILYDQKKEHIQVFVVDSLNIMLKDEMPQDYIINNLLSEIFRDDKLCKNRLITEIKVHQQKVQTGKVDYKKI
jgi:hypothetical protein